MKVANKLTIATPSTELVDAYLIEIAKAYSVKWAPASSLGDNNDGSADGGEKVIVKVLSPISIH